MFGPIFRNARRAKRLTGVQLAKMAGCTQSAISQFEGGKRTALSRDTIEKICEILEIEMPAELANETPQGAAPASGAAASVAPSPLTRREPFCPNAGCLSNVPYVVDGALAFMPRRQPDAGATYCPWFGEVLLRECPHCEAPATRTAFCPSCGAKRIEPPEGVADPVAWAEARRAEIAAVERLI
jgi:transcriptional regulator with XRE-family HTH domain